MGYRVLSNVVMTPYLERSAGRLAAELPFDIVVTSGLRTARAQAQAMFTKIELGDDLIAVYADDSFAEGVIEAYPDIDRATQFVQGYANRGGGSSHLRGLGLDIRTRDLSEREVNQLIETTEFFGWRPFLEFTPPHLHITLPGDEKKSLPLFLLAGGALLWIYLN
jgi:hypothetical protein